MQAVFNKLDGTNLELSLSPEEIKDCITAEYKKPSFTVEMRRTLDFSKASDLGVSDMVDIDELNPASLVFNLATRYRKKQIYTYVGPILLALNPFGPVEGVLGDDIVKRYKEIITTA
jgi:myosin heavy subunit